MTKGHHVGLDEEEASHGTRSRIHPQDVEYREMENDELVEWARSLGLPEAEVRSALKNGVKPSDVENAAAEISKLLKRPGRNYVNIRAYLNPAPPPKNQPKARRPAFKSRIVSRIVVKKHADLSLDPKQPTSRRVLQGAFGPFGADVGR